MRAYKCEECLFEFTESDKNWDVAKEKGNCPKCKKALPDFQRIEGYQKASRSSLTAHEKIYIFLIFLLGGPILGALPFTLIIPSNTPVVVLFSFAIGAIPAGLAGIVFIYITSHLPKVNRYGEFACGALSGFVAVTPFVIILPNIISYIFMSIIGAITGGVCGQASKSLTHHSSGTPNGAP